LRSEAGANPKRIRRTARTRTLSFGSSKRESHDSAPFYSRFSSVEISDDSTINQPSVVDEIFCQDARDMHQLACNSVALVVTSPPYFSGKEYEAELGVSGTPSNYIEYLRLLAEVFSECMRVLEPGGRIAVNVANLGRKPYRSLSADVVGILQDLGFLLRGEIVWVKGRTTSGSCAWGTFAHPANPVLRDVTERVIVGSKGRFDRAIPQETRERLGLPSTPTITKDEFLEATVDVWEIPSESATRVGHPSPFPVELPMRLIQLYSYEGDVVLDPFIGSGTTAVAAVRTGRRYLGFDTTSEYVVLAKRRIEAELRAAQNNQSSGGKRWLSRGVSVTSDALELLKEAGFADIRVKQTIGPARVAADFVAVDSAGRKWAFAVAGSYTSVPSGLSTKDALWDVIARGAVLQSSLGGAVQLLVLTTELPRKGSASWRILESVVGRSKVLRDVIDIGDASACHKLALYARGELI